MTLNNPRNIFVLLLAEMLCVFSLHSNAQDLPVPADEAANASKNKINKFDPPYPFTADELWEKLLNVAASFPDGLTRTNIDKIFSTSLEREAYSNPQISKFETEAWQVSQGKDWFFSMGAVLKNHKAISFSFSWGDSPLVLPPRGMCIPMKKMESTLLKYGWESTSKLRMYPQYLVDYHFIKYMHGSMRITSDGDGDAACLIDFFIVNN
ncbi:hypothetical protein H8K32_13875 [Undibacterium jejuense]|uniref:Uncharacterized protein n=1 Tax=Undibacterium jejuense TaxID=1344949 RepID=A0A923HIS7_9BURK|nr:hypothetical protein [Undibacterium jejuense]MBC3863193.1 hypothetical protein [Undibacterium jejuense]